MVGRSDYKLDQYQITEYTNHEIPRCFFEDETCKFIYIKVYSIEESRYTGTVYNYHCTGNTFIGRYIPTHNCDSIDGDASSSTSQNDVSDFLKSPLSFLNENKYKKSPALQKFFNKAKACSVSPLKRGVWPIK